MNRIVAVARAHGLYLHLGLPEGSFPVSEAIHREVLSLPNGPHMTGEGVDRVIAGVREAASALL